MTYKIDEVDVVVGGAASLQGRLIMGICDSHDYIQDKEREVSGLIHALMGWGVKVFQAPTIIWPRDNWIYHNGQFCERRDHDHLADGGAAVLGEDYVLVPETLPQVVELCRDEVEARLKEMYKLSRVHFMPRLGNLDHLDLGVLIINETRTMVVESFYRELCNGKLDKVAKKEGVRIIEIPDGQGGVFPANSLLLQDGNDQVGVFTGIEEGPSPLSGLLKDEKRIEVVEVPFGTHKISTGGIRCKTNVVPKGMLKAT